tara:strand:+ start:13 stop:474 length:462 start_codon:yes stop_codon:yes gene_type:complete
MYILNKGEQNMELSKKQEKQVKAMMKQTGGCRLTCQTMVAGNLLGVRAKQLENGDAAIELKEVSMYEANNRSYMTNFMGEQMYNQFNPYANTESCLFWKKGEESDPYICPQKLDEHLKMLAEKSGVTTVISGNTGDIYEMTDKMWESHLSVVK